jgi:Transposase zinc-ribbon domain
MADLLLFVSEPASFISMSSVIQFLDRFPDQPACLAHLERVRWPEGRVCPKCKAVDQSLPLARPGYLACAAERNRKVA